VNLFTNELCEEHLADSAVFFSPHFDDETLGCGGTIIKKKRAGAEVKIVFITDGSRSHSHLISRNKLKHIRANEALAASRILGLAENDVIFLDYEETELAKHRDSAIQKVKEILFLQHPSEIFVPHGKEHNLDHLETNRILMSALQTYKSKIAIYEYPIWLWYNPILYNPIPTFREVPKSFKEGLISWLSFAKDFRCYVYIGNVLSLKRRALSQYKSQMTRLIPDPRWRTLGDVANGEFLKCFYQEKEIFYRYILNA
jgi:LmbE family N-acetylglucosaminyl deacetylase